MCAHVCGCDSMWDSEGMSAILSMHECARVLANASACKCMCVCEYGECDCERVLKCECVRVECESA